MTDEKVIQTARDYANSYNKWVQFRSCQAWISFMLDSRYKLIKSYKTIVGLVDYDEKVVYEIGKYSQTTSKQFTQICNCFYRGFERKYIEGRV